MSFRAIPGFLVLNSRGVEGISWHNPQENPLGVALVRRDNLTLRASFKIIIITFRLCMVESMGNLLSAPNEETVLDISTSIISAISVKDVL